MFSLQVDLGVHSRVNTILTKGWTTGVDGGFVTQYNLAISDNGTAWITLQASDGSAIQFAGNVDFSNVARNELPEPMFARYVRLIIVEFQFSPYLKWELEGCN